MAENFQLDPDKFKTGIWGVDGKIKDLIKKINKWDGLNHNGVPEIAEAVAFATRVLPVLWTLYQAIDLVALKEAINQMDWVRDKARFRVALDELETLTTDASKNFPIA